MCGTIKNQGRKLKVGSSVNTVDFKTKNEFISRWTGYIREEKLDWWMKRTKLIPVEIRCNAFIEGRYEIEVPSGRILGYQLAHDVIVDGKVVAASGEVRMLTRAPLNTFESNLRPRWPIVKVGASRKIHAFQPWDIKGKYIAGQMELPMDASE